jgi:hypothetical protein
MPQPDALGELVGRVAALERAEATRAGEHAAMVDQLERLYKRVSARIAREQPSNNGGAGRSDESVLSLRQRLGR